MVILPLCAFANIHWYSWLLHARKVTIDLGEHYEKQTWRNRFDIAGPNGSFACTLTVRGQKGVKTPTSAIEMIDDGWRQTLTKTLSTSYRPAPYFEHYWPEIERLLAAPSTNLSSFNLKTMEWAMRAIEIEREIVISHKYIDADELTLDLRKSFKPSKTLVRTPEYRQVFTDRCGCIDNLSIIDLIMNLGPESYGYLKNYKPESI